MIVILIYLLFSGDTPYKWNVLYLLISFSEGNGIYLDASLTWGKTERCRTFDNPPLCSQEGGSGDFKVALIEVYGLNKLDL